MEMIGESKPAAPKGTVSPMASEETVEFELTAEQQLELKRAAAGWAAPPGEPGTAYDSYICRRTDRVDRVCTIAFATLVLGLTVVTGWRAIDAAPSAPLVVAKVVTPRSVPAPVEEAHPSVVQVINPFDSTEVFELPANTSEADARSAIAELLLQRARERFHQGFDVHRANNRRAHSTADSSSDVFVTRLSSPDERLGGIPSLNAESPAAD